ncbi:hypothetical protein O6H91_06G080600 [Diphasiastrum complanatum]|uniref:Uncharacterized protein n=1 Tax=Diphasiastrum complanatum TaxID=34168 RepID=A0ACC2DFI5_DIPCM|nr:hypothetical protein O6H91_06G080600 [Diphasiastrum complanatum]
MKIFNKLFRKSSHSCTSHKGSSHDPPTSTPSQSFVFYPTDSANAAPARPSLSPSRYPAPTSIPRTGIVSAAKVLKVLGAENIDQEYEIRAMMMRASSGQAIGDSASTDESDSEVVFPVESPSERASPVGLQSSVHSRTVSPAHPLLLSPGADSATLQWSPVDGSGTSTPQMSPRRQGASPFLKDSGLVVAHPLPVPPMDSPTSRGTHGKPALSVPSSPTPVPMPLHSLRQYQSSNVSSGADQSRRSCEILPDDIRSPLPSPQGSPPSSSPRWSYKPSPCRSPHRSPCQSPMRSPARISLCPRRYKLVKEIGRGSFGTVYEALNLEDGSFFAVKVCNNDHVSPETEQEIHLLSKLNHPNIVRYLGTSVILLGLEYLHCKNAMHRDIKCANILVNVKGQVKLADFGVAKQVEKMLAVSVKGTPFYMAPEIMQPSTTASRSYGLPVDIWSLGCTVLEMADGKPPWSNIPGFGFYFRVCRGDLPPIPDHLSNEAKDFILSCLRSRPEDRPTASDLLKHPFVDGAPPLSLPVEMSQPPSPASIKTSYEAHNRSWHASNLLPEHGSGPSVEGLRRNSNIIPSNLRTILQDALP